MRRKGAGESSTTALSVENRGRQREKGKFQRRDKSKKRSKSRSTKQVECWNCGKKGHMRKDCRLKKKEPSDEHDSTSEAHVTKQDALLLSCEDAGDSWVVDSGASFHATPHLKCFKEYTKGNFGYVLLGDDAACAIVGKGTVAVKLANGNEWLLQEVRHIPALRKNLISTGQLDEEGCVSTFGQKKWKVTKGAMVIARGEKVKTLYIYNVGSQPSSVHVTADAAMWHHRLGHMSAKGMQILHSQKRLLGLKKVDLEFFEDCVYGKQKRVRFVRTTKEKKSRKLELVHSDMWGFATMYSLEKTYIMSCS